MRFGSGVVITIAVLATACTIGGSAGPVEREHHTVERGAATRARVEVGMSAGDLSVKSGAAQLLEGDFAFNVPALKPAIAYTVDGTTGLLKVSQGTSSGSHENNWQLSLEEATPVELHITLGAGDAQLVLGRLNLQSVAIQLGAGDLTLDLRGMPAGSYPVSVNAGAGDTTIHLPASAGISVRTLGLVGDTSVTGLEKRDGRWVNPRAEASPVIIDVRVQHAIGDLKLLVE
jgi:predicted membrane protein